MIFIPEGAATSDEARAVAAERAKNRKRINTEIKAAPSCKSRTRKVRDPSENLRWQLPILRNLVTFRFRFAD